MPELLWKAFIDFETAEFEELGDVSLVQSELPKKLKKRRYDSSTTIEEILENAYSWKKQNCLLIVDVIFLVCILDLHVIFLFHSLSFSFSFSFSFSLFCFRLCFA